MLLTDISILGPREIDGYQHCVYSLCDDSQFGADGVDNPRLAFAIRQSSDAYVYTLRIQFMVDNWFTYHANLASVHNVVGCVGTRNLKPGLLRSHTPCNLTPAQY